MTLVRVHTLARLAHRSSTDVAAVLRVIGHPVVSPSSAVNLLPIERAALLSILEDA